MKIKGEWSNCKKEATIDIDDIKLNIPDGPKFQNTSATQTAGTMQELKPEIKEVIKEKVVAPAHIPAYKCKDGNCGQIHKNPNHFSKIKGKCENCGQFTDDINGPCVWCNSKEIEELDEDELNDLGIPEPKEADPHIHE